MPSYRAPGVYIEEKQGGPRSIQGVGTSTAGFLGETERGSVEPQFLTSFADFQRRFGGFKLYREGERLNGTFLAYAVKGFFDNGGTQCFVGRVESDRMPTAEAEIGGTPAPPPRELAASTTELEFPDTPAGSSSEAEVVVTNTTDGSLFLTGATLPDPANGFTVSFVDEEGTAVTLPDDLPYELAANETLVATVEFAPDATDPNPLNDTVELTYAGGAGPLTITFEGMAIAPQEDTLVVEPAALDLGVVPVGTPVVERLALLNAGSAADGHAPFDIEGVDGPEGLPEGATVEMELLDGDGDPVDLGTPHTLAPGDRATLVVTTTFEQEATFDSGAGAPAGPVTIDHTAGSPASPVEVGLTVEGGVELEPDGLSFGTIVSGRTSAEQVVRLTNRRGGALVLDDVSDLDGFDWTVFDAGGAAIADVGGLSLDDGDYIEIRVRFAPMAEEPTEEVLTVTLRDPTTPDDPNSAETSSIRVPLSGVGVSGVMDAEAVGPGLWGRNVAVITGPASDTRDPELFSLTIRYWARDADAAVARANNADPETEDADVPDPDAEEVYDNLSPDETSANYYVTVLGSSNLISVTRLDEGRPATDEPRAVWLDERYPVDLSTAAVDVTDYEDHPDPDIKTGLEAFAEVDEISMVCVPDEVRTQELLGLTDAVVSHCERLRDRVAVLQSSREYARLQPNQKEPPADSSYAAFYYPQTTVRNPETNDQTLVPVGGHVAGIYARTDSQRGVHKAPANEPVRGVLGLQQPVTKDEQEILNPKGINCIRSFPGRGIRVWGARTTSSDPLWRYLNVRRLFLFIEESIEEATQYAVFEPNDEPLWTQIRQSVGNFLTTVWRDGALMGGTAEEAFFVRCDRTTMTQDDIDGGRLIVEVGVAVVKPAEFVVFRFSQKTAEAA